MRFHNSSIAARPSDDATGRIVSEAGHRRSEWPRLWRWVRAGGVDAHRARCRYCRLQQGRDQYRDHPDLRRHAALSPQYRPESCDRINLDRADFRCRRGSASRPRQSRRAQRQSSCGGIGARKFLATKPPLTLAAALGAIHRGMDAAIDDVREKSAPISDADHWVILRTCHATLIGL